jgi:hypothetical protein
MGETVWADRPDGGQVPFVPDLCIRFKLSHDDGNPEPVLYHKLDGDLWIYRHRMWAMLIGHNLSAINSGIESQPTLLTEICRVVTKEEAIELLRRAGKEIPPELADARIALEDDQQDQEKLGQDESAPNVSRPKISITGKDVNVNGTVYVLDDGGAAFVRELIEAGPGHWVSGPEMGEMVQPRPDRVFKKLRETHKAIADLIQSGGPKGYRLKPDVITPTNAKFRP